MTRPISLPTIEICDCEEKAALSSVYMKGKMETVVPEEPVRCSTGNTSHQVTKRLNQLLEESDSEID